MEPLALLTGPGLAERRRGVMLALALAAALAAAGCGRRGAPEPPPDPAAATGKPTRTSARASGTTDPAAGTNAPPSSTTLATRAGANALDDPDVDEEPDQLANSVSPQPTPSSRRRNRIYQVPKEPFILDPLL